MTEDQVALLRNADSCLNRASRMIQDNQSRDALYSANNARFELMRAARFELMRALSKVELALALGGEDE